MVRNTKIKTNHMQLNIGIGIVAYYGADSVQNDYSTKYDG